MKNRTGEVLAKVIVWTVAILWVLTMITVVLIDRGYLDKFDKLF